MIDERARERHKNLLRRGAEDTASLYLFLGSLLSAIVTMFLIEPMTGTQPTFWWHILTSVIIMTPSTIHMWIVSARHERDLEDQLAENDPDHARYIKNQRDHKSMLMNKRMEKFANAFVWIFFLWTAVSVIAWVWLQFV